MPDAMRSRPLPGDRPPATALTRTAVRVAPGPDILRMQSVSAAIFARVEADQRADEEGFRFGRQCGRAEGWVEGAADTDWVWMNTFGVIRRVAEGPSHAELVRRRADDCREPCPVHCGRCSRCIRADYLRRQGGNWGSAA